MELNFKVRDLDVRHLGAIIHYIIWNYDANVRSISDKMVQVDIQEMSDTYVVKITYIAEIVKAFNASVDPTTHRADEYVTTDSQFTLIKSDSFRSITKYTEEICDVMASYEI